VADLELHDEVVGWIERLSHEDWDRAVAVVDRLAELGSTARMPLSRSLGDGLFELALHARADREADHLPVHQRWPDHPADHVPQQRNNEDNRDGPSPQGRRRLRTGKSLKEAPMANYSRWDDVKKRRRKPATDVRAAVEQDLALGQLIYDLRTAAGLSQRALAERMGTTQSVISRLEEGGGAKNRLDTLARVATALDRHLVVSFPEKVPARLKDAVQVA